MENFNTLTVIIGAIGLMGVRRLIISIKVVLVRSR